MRRQKDHFLPQIDHALPAEGAPVHAGRVVAPDEIGSAAVWSPQGGLRASLPELLAIARGLKNWDLTPYWSPGPARKAALFDQHGAGVMILRRPAIYPRPLVGHFGKAYGIATGAWWDAGADVAFSYMLNGFPENDESDDLCSEEMALFARIGELAS